MIEINLLPPEHRPVERTPMPRLLTILVGVLLTMVGMVAWAFLTFVSIPNARSLHEEKVQREAALKREADEVAKLEKEMDVFRNREETLRKLYKERVRWTRVLDRLADARKACGAVVLTRLEYKQGSAGGRGGGTIRQLQLEGYVPSFAEEPDPAQMAKPYYAMVNALKGDEKWLEMFESDPEYKYMRMRDSLGGSRKEDNKDLPTSGLEFCVVFTFKVPDLPQPQKAPVRRPAAKSRSS